MTWLWLVYTWYMWSIYQYISGICHVNDFSLSFGRLSCTAPGQHRPPATGHARWPSPGSRVQTTLQTSSSLISRHWFSGRREMVNLSLANRIGPDPPFRVVTDCKANVKFVSCFRVVAPAVQIQGDNYWGLLPVYWGLNCVHDSIVDSIPIWLLFSPSSGRCGLMSCKSPDGPAYKRVRISNLLSCTIMLEGELPFLDIEDLALAACALLDQFRDRGMHEAIQRKVV